MPPWQQRSWPGDSPGQDASAERRCYRVPVTTEPSLAGSGRAVGAIFFTLFGAAWLALWYAQTGAGGPLGWLVIAAEALILLGFAGWKYVGNRSAPADTNALADRRRANRVFKWANAAQWVLIFGVSEILSRFGHAAWIVPAVLGIVGLHFMPLGAVFRYRPHYITGGALITLAAIYPVLAVQGPTDPVGLFGAGMILWASAAWALTA